MSTVPPSRIAFQTRVLVRPVLQLGPVAVEQAVVVQLPALPDAHRPTPVMASGGRPLEGPDLRAAAAGIDHHRPEQQVEGVLDGGRGLVDVARRLSGDELDVSDPAVLVLQHIEHRPGQRLVRGGGSG
ncbi:hypothetical protein [Streptomyces lavendofoliae]|uniref:Uncharacterized protein n=1 Tax=Streptomyces lavendofoliae TaxID=67314 RepID=A0A918I3K9_9ACTN|nr:hypothetical protein [Streptomyces lavendofoliae]GGU67136.1 hypothetical protein GCM10010274_64550 [Streptomyces lavendofoliae]